MLFFSILYPFYLPLVGIGEGRKGLGLRSGLDYKRMGYKRETIFFMPATHID